MPETDVEQLLVSLILDNRIDGHIDQVNKLLERGDRYVIVSRCSQSNQSHPFSYIEIGQ